MIKRVKPPTFSERLEQRAREIVTQSTRRRDDDLIAKTLEDQLALALEHLDATRALHKELRRSLVCQECYADNELRDMEMRTPKYSPYRFPEREKLQRRLIKIEDERRRLMIAEHETARGVQERILELLGKRVSVVPRG
jgi:hypothetical protein